MLSTVFGWRKGKGPHISNSRFGFLVARTQSYLPERGADSEQVLVSTASNDKLGTMRNIHRWAFFFIAIGIALWMPGVSPQLGIIIFVIGLVGLVIAWVVR